MRFALFNIYLILLTAFFANSLVDYHLIPAHATLVTEMAVYILLIFSFLKKGKDKSVIQLNLIIFFALFCIIALTSIIVNKSEGNKPILSLRLTIRFYLLYLALINLDLSNEIIKKINRFIVVLFLIQLPVVAIKYSYLGVSEETIGTYATKGGGLTTALPIIALSYLAGYYLFVRRNKILILLSIFFIIQGIVGAKAALLFLYPLSFIVFYILYIVDRGIRIPYDLIVLISIAVASLTCGAAILKFQPRLNPEREVGGSINLSHALKYSKKYTTSHNESKGIGTGRYSTTLVVFKELKKGGAETILFGFGPGSLTQSRIKLNQDYRTEKIKRSYGITGFSFYMTEYGSLGTFIIVIIFLILFRNVYRNYIIEEDRYWKGFSYCSVITTGLCFFVFLFYNNLPLNGDLLPILLFYVSAISYLRLHRNKNKMQLKNEKNR